MNRIEWTRLAGEDVEAVVAMFVNRAHPTSTRITPSRGDGGVDILDRDADESGRDVVYQVKRYSEPLNARQKDEVSESLRTLRTDPRWARLKLKEWHLVTPWDPTPEAEGWLQNLAEGSELKVIWDGLTAIDQMAARFPDVVDYYLHGGRARIEDMYERLSSLFAAGQGESGLTAIQVSQRVEQALRALDEDPHYRYEHRFGEGSLPELGGRPDLVFSYFSQARSTSRWVIVDVIARCAASVTERPITISGTLEITAGTPAERELRDFLAYGTPFRSPEGAYRGHLDAPGGLGGAFSGATMRTWPVADLGEDTELHIQILDPNDRVLAEANLRRVERSAGEDGIRMVFEEEQGTFTIEDRVKYLDQSGSRVIRVGRVVGEPVAAVVAGLAFLAHCHEPNVGRLSLRHTPPALGVKDPTYGLINDEGARAAFKSLAGDVGALAQIQQRTSEVIRVPDSTSVSQEQVRSWHFAAALIRGETAISTYPDGQNLVVVLDTSARLPSDTFVLAVPLKIRVGGRTIDLGEVYVEFPESTVLARVEQESGQIAYAISTAGRITRYSLSAEALQA